MSTRACVALITVHAGFCCLQVRGPPDSTPLYSSAASDVYKGQEFNRFLLGIGWGAVGWVCVCAWVCVCLIYTSPSPRDLG